MFRARTLASLLALAAGACARNPAFQLADGTDATGSATTGAQPSTGTSLMALDLSSGTDTSAGSTTASPATTTGLVATTGDTLGDASTGEPAGPESCRQAKDMGMASGLTKISPPNQPGATIAVWCEQDIADGGWMLVGRSAKDAKGTAFGWTHDLGDPAAFDEPYSLDAVALDLPMTQILVGMHVGDNSPGKHVYALTVPGNFLTGYADAPAPVTTVFTVAGDCKPPGGPTMLRFAGYTDLKDRFRLRDLPGPENDTFGLRIDGLRLNYANCFQGADLDEEQGVLFVR